MGTFTTGEFEFSKIKLSVVIWFKSVVSNLRKLCRFAEILRSYRDVFTFLPGRVTLHDSLSTAEDRTRAVGDVVKSLGEELIPGIRNEVLLVLNESDTVLCVFVACDVEMFEG